VYRKDCVNNKESVTKVLLGGGPNDDIFALTKVLHFEMKRHMENEQRKMGDIREAFLHEDYSQEYEAKAESLEEEDEKEYDAAHHVRAAHNNPDVGANARIPIRGENLRALIEMQRKIAEEKENANRWYRRPLDFLIGKYFDLGWGSTRLLQQPPVQRTYAGFVGLFLMMITSTLDLIQHFMTLFVCGVVTFLIEFFDYTNRQGIDFSVFKILKRPLACLYFFYVYCNSSGLAFYLLLMPLLKWGMIVSAASFVVKDRIKMRIKRRFDDSVTAIAVFFSLKRASISSRKIAAIGLVTLAGVLCAWYAAYKKKDGKEEESAQGEGSDFVKDEELKSKLNVVEDLHHCGGSIVRTVRDSPTIWNVVNTSYAAAFSGNPLELEKGILRNVRKCVIKSSVTKHMETAYGLGICNNFAVFPKHCFGGEPIDGSVVNVCITGIKSPGEKYCTTVVSNGMWDEIGVDLIFVQLSQVSFRDIRAHISSSDDAPPFANARISGYETTASYVIRDMKVNATKVSYILPRFLVYDYPLHKQGVCGIPIMLQIGKGFSIFGIHVAGAYDGPLSFATLLNVKDINQVLEKWLKEGTILMPIMSEAESLPFAAELPNVHSPFRHETINGMDYYGKLPVEVSVKAKSKLVRSRFHSEGIVDEIFSRLDFTPSTLYTRPLMQPIGKGENYISPYNIALRKLGKQKRALDPAILGKITVILFNRLDSLVSRKSMNPLTVEVAINGDPQDAYLRRINASTSAGFGWSGVKAAHIPLVDRRQEEVYREPVAPLKQSILSALESYSAGKRMHYVYRAKLKDEPRSIEKVKEGKTRVFYMSSLDALILARMYLGPLYTTMVEDGDPMCTAVGINMHLDSQKLYDRLVAFSPLYMAGDYGNYDQLMPFGISWAACSVILKFLKSRGYNDSALEVTRGVLSDSLFPIVEMNGDMFCSPGQQPSGKYATAEDNGIKGLLLLMYFWYSNDNLCEKDFFDHVLPVTYGDDLIAAVKPSVAKYFNNVTYRDFVQEVYGMTYTDPVKGEVVDEFMSIDEISFLRRKFVYREDLKRIVSPLDMNSLYRSLEWMMPSQSEPEPSQYLSTCVSFMRELFFHVDEKKYMEIRRLVVESFSRVYKISVDQLWVHFPSFGGLRSQLCPDANTVMGGRQSDEKDTTMQLPDEVGAESGFCRGVVSLQFQLADARMNFSSYFVSSRPNNNLIYRSQDSIENLRKLQQECTTQIERLKDEIKSFDYVEDIQHLRSIKQEGAYLNNVEFRDRIDSNVIVLSKLREYEMTLGLTQKALSKVINRVARAESEPVSEMKSGPIDSSDVVRHQNVVDVGGTAPTYSDASKTFYSGQMKEAPIHIQSFLARPVQVLQTTISTSLSSSIRVWDTFLEDPAVRAKLRNVAHLRGTLHARITISGTPFHFGKLLVSYIPMISEQQYALWYEGHPLERENFLRYLVQCPGSRVMDVRANTPHEMSFPFVFYAPKMRLFNSATTVLSSATHFNDAFDLGTLYLYTLNDVGAVTPTPTPVSVDVYAWMTDVQMGCPTGTVMEVLAESKSDERVVGPIEHIASNAARVAGAASNIPVIGRWAKASHIAFSGLRDLSALMGWSTPVLDVVPNRVKNEPFQNGALTISSDTGKRLTLDPLQELTVDPSFVSESTDELTFSSFCSRPGLLDSFEWKVSDTPMTDIVWRSLVNPGCIKQVGTLRQPTPVAFASRAFEYWRGTLKYRLEFVCSNFHRGKIAIIFEPNIYQTVLIDAALNLNKQYVHIIDLQEVQDFEFCVNWAFPRAWARTFKPGDEITSVGNFTSDLDRKVYCSNGYLIIVPLTKLQSPDDSSVNVNVYVSSDDMLFNSPTLLNLPSAALGESEPVTSLTCLTLNDTEADTSDICMQHFGEMPISFRSLLKRFHRTNSIIHTVDSGEVCAGWELPIIPTMSPTPYVAATDTVSLLSYLRPAFLAMRGGFRKRVRLLTALYSDSDRINVTRSWATTTTATPSSYSLTGPSETRLEGTVSFVPATNGGIEFELPCYTNNLFFSSSYEPPSISNHESFDRFASWNYWIEYDHPNSGEGDTITMVEETATADDFMLSRFIAVPPFV
jgi:hypothetical protein